MIKEGSICLKSSCNGIIVLFDDCNKDILYCPNCGLYYNKNDWG